MARRYTNEHHAYLQEVIPGRYNDEVVELFQEKFGITLSVEQLKNYKANRKLKSGLPNRRKTPQKKLFSPEQAQFIRDNVSGIGNEKLMKMVNNEFGTEYTTSQVKAFKQRNRLSSGLDGNFEKGHIPRNKGTKGLYNAGGNCTSFKKGHIPSNHKPLGYERIDKDGYTLVKISNEGEWHNRWRHKHKVIWEEANGKIPPGHVLIFGDKNKQNITLDNLILISNKQLAVLNRKGLIQTNVDLTRTGIILADIYSKMHERKKEKSNK